MPRQRRRSGAIQRAVPRGHDALARGGAAAEARRARPPHRQHRARDPQPAAAISHAAELLDEERRDAQRVRLTRIIHDNTQRLERLVSDVLQLNRARPRSAERIRLRQLAEALRRGVRRERVGAAGALRGRDAARGADRVRPRAPAPGDVEPAAQRRAPCARERRQHPHLDATPCGDRVELSVIDDGPGVAAVEPGAAVRAVLHHRQQGDRPGPVYRARAVRRQPRGARIRATRPQGRTSASSPAPPSHEAHRQAMRRLERRGAGRGPQVLVVDDEPDLLELLELTLSRMGLDTSTRGRPSPRRRTLLDRTSASTCASPTCACPTARACACVEHITEQGLDVPVAVITALRQRRERGRGAQGRRVRLPREAGRARAAARAGASRRCQAARTPAQPRERASSCSATRARDRAGARPDRQARAQRRRRCTSPASRAAARSSPRALIHANGARARAAVRAGQLRRDSREPDGERVLRLQARARSPARTSDRDGFFQAANGGTLFLDEVADLPLAMQVKLLRAIQEKKVRKVGATQEEPVDVRIISATHKNLAALVDAGEFRQDLFYRLNVIELQMPPLREMREDIPAIAQRDPRARSRAERHRRPRLAAGRARGARALRRSPATCASSRTSSSARWRFGPRARSAPRTCTSTPEPRTREPVERGRQPGGRVRCRTTSTASSARRSTRRSRRRATTAPRRRSCSASRSAQLRYRMERLGHHR